MGLAIGLGGIVGWMAARSGKSQDVRALDVLVLGPLMILVAAGGLKGAAKFALVFAGAATVTFNARNFSAESST